MGLSRCASIFYGITFGSMAIFGIALLSTHSVFMQMVAARGVKVAAYGMNETQCKLVSAEIVQHRGTPLTWSAVWTAVRPGDEESIYSAVITSPFSRRIEQAQAARDLKAWPLNSTFPCVCPPLLATSFDRACMLEVNIVHYLQQEAVRYGYAEAALVGIGAVSVLFALVGLVVLLWDTECFWQCCNKARKKMGLQDFYTLEGEE
jgi:hypothetical protein